MVLRVGKGNFRSGDISSVDSTGHADSARALLWGWMTSGNANYVKLDRMMISTTNRAVDEHNKTALKKFPGDQKYKLFSITQVTPEEIGPHSTKKKDRMHIVISPEMKYGYAPTGVLPPHCLELKIRAPVMITGNVFRRS